MENNQGNEEKPTTITDEMPKELTRREELTSDLARITQSYFEYVAKVNVPLDNLRFNANPEIASSIINILSHKRALLSEALEAERQAE